MATPTALAMLCTDLGLLPENVQGPLRELLEAKLETAALEIQDAGIELDETSTRDLDLLVIYAAWLYRGRVKQTDKPQLLQRLLRNRQVSQSTGGGVT